MTVNEFDHRKDKVKRNPCFLSRASDGIRHRVQTEMAKVQQKHLGTQVEQRQPWGTVRPSAKNKQQPGKETCKHTCCWLTWSSMYILMDFNALKPNMSSKWGLYKYLQCSKNSIGLCRNFHPLCYKSTHSSCVGKLCSECSVLKWWKRHDFM